MMKKRVYGVLGISSVMANWNADFGGFPKSTSDGRVFGSDKAFKYPMKKMWNDEGEKVLYIKSYTMVEKKKEGEVKLTPKTLLERYQQLFGTNELKDVKKVLSNLFTATDVKNFGATFAEKKSNISITGVVQFGQGFNKYDGTEAQEQQILSPFRDPKAAEKNKSEEEAKNSTLGTKIVSDEAHYFYPFSINPNNYREYVEMGVTDGYTEEDYAKFKKTSLVAATSYATNAKAGCENEMGLFVETAENVYLPDLCEEISFQKKEEGMDKNVISIQCGQLLKDMGDRILAVELYYNPFTTKIETDIENLKCFNIFTGKPIER